MQLKKDKTKGVRFRDLTNIKFGKLTALSPIKKWGSSKYFWICKCDCGRTVEVIGSNLVRNNTTSCGCYGRSIIGNKTKQHGMSKTRIFKIWAGMRKRCNNPNFKSYSDYGGRGIKVCNEWDSFIAFYNDMKEGYADNLSLERKNPDGNYCKENCRWATMKEQSRNKTNTRYIEFNGKRKTASEWCEGVDVDVSTFLSRIKNGKDIPTSLYGNKVTDINEISKYLVF